jgi:aspartate/methionine/tyrosine aminotransferase
MAFPGPHFMAWAKRLNHDIKYDLFSSGLDGLMTPKELGVTLDAIKLDGEGDYSYGYMPLRELLAAKYDVHPGQVMTSQGSSAANFLIAAAIFESPGEQAIVESPCYQPLLGAIQGAGAGILRLDRRFQDRYRVDLDQIRKFWNLNIRLIVLTRLHNPSGVDIPAEILVELNEFAAAHDAWVLVDEVFLDFMDDPMPAASIGERLISTASFTKVYGMGDLRFGWGVGDQAIIQRAREINDYISVHNPFISEYLGYRILSSDAVMATMRQRISARVMGNRRILDEWLRSIPEWDWVPPDGGIIFFPKVGSGNSGDKLAELLLEEYQCAVTPGSFFDHPGHIRLGFGIEPEVFQEGLSRLRDAFYRLTG